MAFVDDGHQRFCFSLCFFRAPPSSFLPPIIHVDRKEKTTTQTSKSTVPPVRHGPALRRQARREARGVAGRGAGDGQRRAGDGGDGCWSGSGGGSRRRRRGGGGSGRGFGCCCPAWQGESGCSIRRRRRRRRWRCQGRRGQRRRQGREGPGAGVKKVKARKKTEHVFCQHFSHLFSSLRNFCEAKKNPVQLFFLPFTSYSFEPSRWPASVRVARPEEVRMQEGWSGEHASKKREAALF